MGEAHTAVIIERLKRKFGAAIATHTPKVPYRETIRGTTKVHGRYKKQTGGHGMFGDVWLELEPNPGAGVEFAEKVVGGSVPKGFFAGVEKGVREAAAEGVLAGYPLSDFKATLYDGSFHPVDSNELSFKIAASMALKDGVHQAQPALLEPIMAVEIRIPEQYMGEVNRDLNGKRGRVLGHGHRRRRPDHHGARPPGGALLVRDRATVAGARAWLVHGRAGPLRGRAGSRRREGHRGAPQVRRRFGRRARRSRRSLTARRGGSSMSRLERIALVGLPLLVTIVLLSAIDRDPAQGMTFSNAPFSDEGWRVVNARNFVLLGAWSTDDWALHLVQFPLSVAQAVVFSVAGVGLVQARLISVAAAVAMAGILVYGLRRPLGPTGAFAAAVAGSMSALTLYYGRLALLEVPVALALSVAAVGVIRVERGSVGRWGCACGLAIAVALGLKANALPSVLGILGAGAVRSIREPELRRFLPLAIVIVATAAIVWFAAIAVPNLDQVGVVVPWLVQGAIPRSVAEWLGFVGRFATSNDGLVGLAWPLFMAAAVGGLIVIWEGIRFRRDGTATLGGPARVALVGVFWAGAGLIGHASFDYQPNCYAVLILPGLALLVGAGASVIATRMAVRAPWIRAAAAAAIVLFLAAPGLLTDSAGRAGTGHRALEGQKAVEHILPAGVEVGGTYAALFAMRVPAATIVTTLGTINAGDLYADGIRWFFIEDGASPLSRDHPAEWAARQELWCTTWGQSNSQTCLVRLP